MKVLIMVIVSVVIFISIYRLSNYEGRMKEYNKYVCANYGYKEDCKTPLNEAERLK